MSVPAPVGVRRGEVARESLGYRPALDGVRAVAIAGVLASHVGLPGAEGAALGVDVFFTLSGFLITTLMLEELQCRGTVGLGRFWSRRAARLLPALAALVVVVTAYCVFVTDPGTARRTLSATPFVILYSVNWLWATGHHPGLYGHLWSLSAEEQFYIVWPVVLGLVARRRNGAVSTAKTIVVVAAAGMTGSALVRLALYPGIAHISRIYGTDFVADQLLAGCALAAVVWLGAVGTRRDVLTHTFARLFPAAALTVAATAVVLRPSQGDGWFLHWFCTGGLSITALASAAAIGHLALSPEGRAARVLSARAVVWLGERSYGLYLWHIVVLTVARNQMGLRDGIVAWGVQIGLSLIVAAASYSMIERPMRRRLNRRFSAA